MEFFKQILEDVDEVDLTPMIDVTFFAFDLFHGNHDAEATGSGIVYPIAWQTTKQ